MALLVSCLFGVGSRVAIPGPPVEPEDAGGRGSSGGSNGPIVRSSWPGPVGTAWPAESWAWTERPQQDAIRHVLWLAHSRTLRSERRPVWVATDGGDGNQLTNRESWAIIHGMVLGTLFLLAFGGGLAGLWSPREKYLTSEGLAERSPRLLIGTVGMAMVAWAAVIVGTWVGVLGYLWRGR